jgi:hypothetical protein
MSISTTSTIANVAESAQAAAANPAAATSSPPAGPSTIETSWLPLWRTATARESWESSTSRRGIDPAEGR